MGSMFALNLPIWIQSWSIPVITAELGVNPEHFQVRPPIQTDRQTNKQIKR